jgi:hypothetical protein
MSIRWCQFYIFFLFIVLVQLSFGQQSKKTTQDINAVYLSQNFLYAAKTGETTTTFQDSLKHLDERILNNQLQNDHQKLAFWLNLYNGYTQVLLKKDPEQYKTRNAFFSTKNIDVAGQHLSLDEIEHGILRRSKIKWSEGYLDKPFPSAFEKDFRVKKLDYRIHFALNCGAKSCPPIAFYDPVQIEKQLTVAVKTYLKGECEYNEAKNTISVPALMSWFRHDFGGKKGIYEILKQNKIIPAESYPTIKFKKYDWSLFLNNYKSESNG